VEELGEKIKRLMREQNITQEELEKKRYRKGDNHENP
jgi:transcriptional regulator with XRE-family HTH domain